MPFLTEELWEHLTEGKGQPLIAAAWPEMKGAEIQPEAEIDWIVRLISEVRAARAELNVPPSAELPLFLQDADATAVARVEKHGSLVRRLARLSSIAPLEGAIPKGAVQIAVGVTTVILPLAGVVDVAKERARLEKDDAKLAGEVVKIEKKLGNPDFVAKAPEEVVEENRERLSELAAERTKVQEALTRLAAF
jgi:valyl-tRNA synthetase